MKLTLVILVCRSLDNLNQAVETLENNRMPDIALSTDIIVGFPGETEEDFEQTLSLAETVRYAQAYTFIYSKRAGTTV